MPISDEYSREIRRHLNSFPMWPPGQSVSPGDVGELVKGVFCPQTTLQKLLPDLAFKVTEESEKNTTRFQSEGTTIIQASSTGAVPAVGEIVGHATSEIRFARGGAVVFHAVNCTRRHIENLHSVRQYISAQRKTWPSGYVLVSQVESAERFAVFISSTAGAWVQLTGKAKALREFQVADASVAIINSQSLGYERASSGPVMLSLYGFRLLKRMPELLAGSAKTSAAEEAEFAELSAHDPAHDA